MPAQPVRAPAASDIATAVTAGTSLESRLRTSRETCPDAGQGAGGPLPLCEGAAAGEVREGVLELGDSTRFVRSATETAALLQSVADPTKSQSFAWRPATIACTPADPGCEHCLLLVFVPTTANMQGLQPTLAFDVSIEGGVWTIERLVSFYTQLRAMVAPIVTGGTLANPPHGGLVDFLTYYPWAPPR